MKRFVPGLTAVALSALLTAVGAAAASPALASPAVGSPALASQAVATRADGSRVVPAPAHAAPQVPSSRPIYLALGDSLSAGHGSFPETGSFRSTVLQWKARGFVAQFHDRLRDTLDCGRDRPVNPREGCPRLQTVNLARTGIPGVPGSGVTTQTLLAPGDQLDQAIALIEERNGDASPRNDVEVISLTVGGNDLFAPALGACVLSPDPATTCAPALGATFTGFAARYDQILTELRAAAGDDVTIMTTTYYNPLPHCTLGAGNPASGPVGDWILEGGTLPGPLAALGTLDQGFNDIVRAVSAAHGAVVVDTFGALGAGDFVGGADCLHPDAEGHAAVAALFGAAFPE